MSCFSIQIRVSSKELPVGMCLAASCSRPQTVVLFEIMHVHATLCQARPAINVCVGGHVEIGKQWVQVQVNCI